MDKACKIVNEMFGWIMYVDRQRITFHGSYNADYFAKHYEELGYTIEWDRDKWLRDE